MVLKLIFIIGTFSLLCISALGFSFKKITGSPDKTQNQITINEEAKTTANNVYYPKVSPSAWYALPGRTLSFTGSNFAPSENIVITSDAGINLSVTADQRGNFSLKDAVTVSFDWQDSTKSFTFRGTKNAYDVTLGIKIGRFYPQIRPSTYFIGMNKKMSATGVNFAPGEKVRLQINGNTVSEQTASSQGRVQFNFNSPNSGSSFNITATGLSSNRSNSKEIKIRP